jgi:hypothetical protein
MRRILVIGAATAVVLAAGLASVVAFRPSPAHAGGLHRAKPGTAAVTVRARWLPPSTRTT